MNDFHVRSMIFKEGLIECRLRFPVFLYVGAVGTSAKQDWIPAEGSVVDQGDVFSNCGQLQDLDFVEGTCIL